MLTRTQGAITIADEVWVATALLHGEHPSREDFTLEEIESKVEALDLFGRLRPGVRVHTSMHCVANKKPNPANYCMLFATGRNTRRLYRPGDPSHPDRVGKTTPAAGDLPPELRYLLQWYHGEYAASGGPPEDPILAARGVGSELWKDVDVDEHVDHLRERWQ